MVNRSGCDKEPLVVDAALRCRWDADLLNHVSACRECADAAAAASFLEHVHEADYRRAEIPSAAQMWWKMQLRVRREAIERAARPISLLQSTTLILALLSFAGLCASQWDAVWKWSLTILKSWSLFLLAGFGAAALVVMVMVLLARPEE